VIIKRIAYFPGNLVSKGLIIKGIAFFLESLISMGLIVKGIELFREFLVSMGLIIKKIALYLKSLILKGVNHQARRCFCPIEALIFENIVCASASSYDCEMIRKGV